ncbi:YkgJ family cysteine cluster protein [Sideroxyarcus sp. TK5]
MTHATRLGAWPWIEPLALCRCRATNMPRKIAIASGSKCSRCTTSSCCTYITQAIRKPRTRSDYLNLLWQVSHEHGSVFNDKEGWYLKVEGRCVHLQADGRCGIYEHRPDACREHSDESCEFDLVLEDEFKLFFPSYESLLAHCRKKFKHWDEALPVKKKKRRSRSD